MPTVAPVVVSAGPSSNAPAASAAARSNTQALWLGVGAAVAVVAVSVIGLLLVRRLMNEATSAVAAATTPRPTAPPKRAFDDGASSFATRPEAPPVDPSTEVQPQFAPPQNNPPAFRFTPPPNVPSYTSPSYTSPSYTSPTSPRSASPASPRPSSSVGTTFPAAQAVALDRGLAEWSAKPNRVVGGLKVVEADSMPLAQYGWMVDLLPQLGHIELYDKFDFSRPWSDKSQVRWATAVVPQFVNPSDSRTRWVGFPYENLGLTHYVGVSGVEDKRTVVAARLPRDDPRVGVFGYDHIARAEEITDGTSQTLMVIGSGEIAAPWIQGGGATVRGAREPYFDSLGGFGSRGQPGALAVMADGSVRLVKSTIDPSVFRAMCTIHGAEKYDLAPGTEPAALR